MGWYILGWYIFAALIGLVIHIVFCSKFAGIAEEKGHTRSAYFWICFVFGTIGYIMVAALPDYELRKKVYNLTQVEKTPSAKSSVGSSMSTNIPQPQRGEWKCSCGRVNASFVSTCSCGNNRHYD